MAQPTSESKNASPWLYWASTGLVFIAFMGSGWANVLHADHVMVDMVRLGYPSYFSSILGAWKVAGALCVVVPRFPRLKEWAYAGMVFDLSGAALSRAAIHDQALTIIAPLLVLCVVLVSWKTRPAPRVSRAFAWPQHGMAPQAGGR